MSTRPLPVPGSQHTTRSGAAPITGRRRRHERRAHVERATGIARSATARALASAAAAARGPERRRHAGARGRDVRPRR